MAKGALKIKPGLDAFINDVDLSVVEATHIIEAGVYDGAGMVADTYQEEILNIPIDNRRYVPTGQKKTGITSAQRAGLYYSLGIAPFRYDDGSVQTKVGFDGYNTIQTDAWPKGQPNSMIARSLMVGTSFLQAYDFITITRRKIEARARAAMGAAVEKNFHKIVKP